MIKVKKDITGWKMWEHGIPQSRIIIVQQAEDYIKPNGKHEAMWLCRCNCGNSKIWPVVGYQITSGKTLSCGCVRKEHVVESCKKYNSYNLEGSFGIGIASNCNEEFYFDLEDYDKIKEYCWYKDFTTGYIKTKTPDNKWIYLHRFLINNQYTLVDHINHNKLDNRKANLRNATKKQNMLNRDGVISTNTSGITGVYFRNKSNKWIAQICIDNQVKYLGIFSDRKDAIKARLQAEAKYFKKFAPQRHLFKQYGILEDDFLE